MHKFNLLLASLFALLIVPQPAQAQMQGVQPEVGSASRLVTVESWVEEWDNVSQSWVRVSDAPPMRSRAEHVIAQRAGAAKPPAIRSGAKIEYGPFRVLDGHRAALVGATDSRSPYFFDLMLRDHPDLGVLEMIEGPGTHDDLANMSVGRKIRAAGMATVVPRNGSVRSGAVELFLAGTSRMIANGAEFAVHSWQDNYGKEPADYDPNGPENRLYLDYYEEMGMGADHARAFYDMTNSVPHETAIWLGAEDMREWMEPTRGSVFGSEADHQPVTPQEPEFMLAGTAAPEAVQESHPIVGIQITSAAGPQLAYGDVTLLDFAPMLP